MAEPYPKSEPLEPEELEARRLDAALGRFWQELVRLPSRQKTPGRQYVTALLDEEPHWTTNDRDFEHAATWTPNVFLAGLDDENVVEIPALFVVLQTAGDAIPVSEQARARLEELGLPAPHYELADETTLTLLWRIQPFHRPKKADLRPDQVAAWNNGKLWWQVAMAKLELAFRELQALPCSFTRRLSLPHPSPRSRYLENGAHLLDAAPELPTLRVADISKPLNALDAEAWKRVRPQDPRAPQFLLGKKAWLGSQRFLDAREPKRQGERHAAALTQTCCYRWAGYDRQAILSELRAWAETNVDTRGFPDTRARSDEINDLVEWALRRLVPGGPTQRDAPIRGHYTKRDAALACVLAFLEEHAAADEWIGTISDLASAATLHAAQSAQGQAAGLHVALTKDSLKKLLPELRGEHGVLTVVERSGETWTTRWRLARPAAAAPKPSRSTIEDPTPPAPVRTAPRPQTGEPRCESMMSIGPPALPLALVSGPESDLCVRDPNQEGGSGGRALPPDDPPSATPPRISDPVAPELFRRSPNFELSAPGLLAGSIREAPRAPRALRFGEHPVSPELEARVFGLCALGLSLTLLKPGSKEPVRERWTPAQRHRTSPERLLVALAMQPEANLAIVCGEVSNIVVVDLDSSDAARWAQEHLAATPIKTKTARGEHWFFRWPGPVKNQRRLRGVDADVKADGGYVVAPGSLHPTGVLYEALGAWTADVFAQLPTFDRSWLDDASEDEVFGNDMIRALKEALRSGPSAVRALVDRSTKEVSHASDARRR